MDVCTKCALFHATRRIVTPGLNGTYLSAPKAPYHGAEGLVRLVPPALSAVDIGGQVPRFEPDVFRPLLFDGLPLEETSLLVVEGQNFSRNG